MRDLALRGIRRLLKQIGQRLEERSAHPSAPAENGQREAVEALLASLDLPPADREYLHYHRARLIRTFSLVPLARDGCRRALELGSYVHGAAVLQRVLGYQEVRGAYYAAAPGSQPDRRQLAIAGQPLFHLDVDLFDAERNRFPYPDASFDVVLCAELIEHLTLDPMHLLFECHRVLADNGLLLLSTPNAASLHSVANALHGRRSPQVFSAYPDPQGHPDIPHVREYTAPELAEAASAGGYAIEALFTEPIAGFENSRWVIELLAREGFDTTLRGEQTYCVARKRSALPQNRYPGWLYARATSPTA